MTGPVRLPARRASPRDPWAVVTGVWLVVTAVGGVLPPLGPRGFQAGGAGYHLVGFSVLTVLLSRRLPPSRAAAAAWLYGLLLEGVQWFLPHRGAELEDLLVNLVAVAVGLVGVAVWRTATDR